METRSPIASVAIKTLVLLSFFTKSHGNDNFPSGGFLQAKQSTDRSVLFNQYTQHVISLRQKQTMPSTEPRPIKSAKLVEGTPLHFREIVIGRCWQYQMTIGLKQIEQINCEKVWDNFAQAFSFKGPCEVTTKDYMEFLDKIEEDVPKDKGLLWSGCRELAHKYSDFQYTKRLITLEDTLAGYLVNGLSWCGKKQPPGINYDACPYECSIQAPYWAVANLKFARKLEGVVHILLNGTRMHLNDGRVYPTYLKDRYYFGPYVIPNINYEKVKKVNIIVAHTLGLNPLEKCNEKTVKQLQSEIAAKGIKVSCQDDPSFVKHLLCIGEYNSIECRR